VVKSIYYSVKQVAIRCFPAAAKLFARCCWCVTPSGWSLAFQTNLPRDVGSRLDGEYVGVFIPTTPSPVNGFYFFVKKSDTIEVGISVDDALKYIISMGVVTPSDKDSPVRVYPGD
jgi:uncharacterized membrane protein